MFHGFLKFTDYWSSLWLSHQFLFPLVSDWQLNFLTIKITLGTYLTPLFHVHICQVSFQVYPESCLPTHIVLVLINATTSQISVLALGPHPCLLVVHMHPAARRILFKTRSCRCRWELSLHRKSCHACHAISSTFRLFLFLRWFRVWVCVVMSVFMFTHDTCVLAYVGGDACPSASACRSEDSLELVFSLDLYMVCGISLGLSSYECDKCFAHWTILLAPLFPFSQYLAWSVQLLRSLQVVINVEERHPLVPLYLLLFLLFGLLLRTRWAISYIPLPSWWRPLERGAAEKEGHCHWADTPQ